MKHPNNAVFRKLKFAMARRFGGWAVLGLCAVMFSARAGNYTNFAVSIYIPVNAVQSFDDPEKLASDWNRIHSQLKVDKVYIEVQRDRRLASDELLERVKKFFVAQGVQVA